MIIEDFDFDEFFLEEKRHLQAKNAKYDGVGSVLVITQNQAVIRWNDMDMSSSGKMEKGLSIHPTNLRGITSDILGIGKEKTKEEESLETRLLSHSIFAFLSNGSIRNIIIYVPNSITSNQVKAFKSIFSLVSKSIDNIDIIIDSIKVDNDLPLDKKIDFIVNNLNDRIDDKLYDIGENIVVRNVINLNSSFNM